MKAKFFFLGLCALALAACSIDEVSQVNDTNAVTFKATTATRATVNTTNNLQEFTVWAWNDTNEFMDHVLASKQSNGLFTTSPYYFWPTGSVDFYALAPASVGYGVDNTSGDELAYIGGSISINDDDLGGTHFEYTGNVATADIQEDNIVIEAYIPGTTDEQIDLIYAIAKERSSGAVPMNFRHALSQVVFKAKDINTDFVVDIAEVSVCSVNKHGTYTLSKVASTTDDITVATEDSHGVWSGVDYKTRFEASCTPQTLATDGTTVDITGDPLLLIPQEVEGWDPLTDADDTELGSYIRVLCHVTEHGSTLWPNANEENKENVYYPDTNNPTTEYAYIAMPVDVDWEEGYRYTYTIVFGNGLGYYPPDDPNTDLEGTPVLVPITFNVTVDEFQDAAGVEVPTATDLSTINVSTLDELKGAIRSGYQEIVVTDDITLTDQIDVSYDLHLVLEANLTKDSFADNTNTEMNYFFHVINGATLTIDADEDCEMASGGENGNDADDWVGCIVVGSYSSTEGILEYGHVIINSGSYYGGVWDANVNCYNSVPTVYVMAGDAVINGGTFYGGWSNEFKSDGAKNESGWTENTLNCNDTPRKNGEAWIYVYGGKFRNFDPANNATEGDNTNFCAEGYSTVSSTDSDGNTWYTVYCAAPNSYSELEALVDGGYPEITITQDMELEYELDFISDCVLTIAPGVTISVPDYESSYVSWSTALIKVRYGSTVDIYAEGATVTTVGDAGSVDIGAIWVNDGTVNVYGGTYKGGVWGDPEGKETTSSSACVYVEKGLANIYDGTFLSGYSGNMKQTSILNCSDANYNASTANITCYGGTYQNFDPSNCLSEGANTNFCATGYKTTSETGADGLLWYTVVGGN